MELLNVAVRFGLYFVLAAAFGIPLFALYSPGVRDALPLRVVLAMSGAAGLILSAIGLLVVVASMGGTGIAGVDVDGIAAVLTGMSLGMAWFARVAGLLAVVAAAAAWRRSAPAMLALASLGGGVAIASLAWSGHGVMDQGPLGWFHLVADIGHLLAAGAWAGALMSLLFLVTRLQIRISAGDVSATHRALDGFSRVGTSVVGVIVVTGIANSWLLVGPANVAALPATTYGQLLIAKIAVFAAMLGLAAANRFRLTPWLAGSGVADDWSGAVTALRASLAAETACLVAVLALVSWLGTIEPSSMPV
ncbi:copper homeostasis membrane protein CopD [Sphingomonas donggukensis]|uniref:Copper homeostasis membrane protein CopD n=1 Tax=Sphingomonas donggukensis TaxID=2949093 RepID=A0ABY4TTV4_9SPHN|nr:copper homeostasis membrane protein CopD [Sphingomonas donggukensis]URW75840.1 copper homeostasis membrane protein CopD [Sphingomonas donggukensis]